MAFELTKAGSFTIEPTYQQDLVNIPGGPRIAPQANIAALTSHQAASSLAVLPHVETPSDHGTPRIRPSRLVLGVSKIPIGHPRLTADWEVCSGTFRAYDTDGARRKQSRPSHMLPSRVEKHLPRVIDSLVGQVRRGKVSSMLRTSRPKTLSARDTDVLAWRIKPCARN